MKSAGLAPRAALTAAAGRGLTMRFLLEESAGGLGENGELLGTRLALIAVEG